MNISKLSNETLVKLVKLAVECNPTAVVNILLDNIETSPAVTEPNAFGLKEIHGRSLLLEKICRLVFDANRVEAIKTLRAQTGMGLKETKDAIYMATGSNPYNEANITRDSHYWYHAIKTYYNTGKTIMSI
jgi:ribosomal protein L7/L12